MAGTKELEEVLDGIHAILNLAKREGPNSWTFDGTALVVKSRPLAIKIQQVLAGIDKVELAEEGGDLSPFEMIRLYRISSDLFPAILALATKE